MTPAAILGLLLLAGCAGKHSPCLALTPPHDAGECAVSELDCSQDVSDGWFDCTCPDGSKWSWRVVPHWQKRVAK